MQLLDLLIDCGGSGGSGWSADAYSTNGTTYNFGGTIDVSGVPNPPPADQVATVRYRDSNPLNYTITGLINGVSYKFGFYFCETAGGAGRQFHIEIDGVRKISDYDIYATAGNTYNKATYLEYTVVASGTSISVDFISSTLPFQPIIGNIRVQELAPTSILKTISGTARLQKTVEATQIGTARLQKTSLVTQSGLARLQKTSLVTQSALARLQKTVEVTQSGLARLQKTQLTTQNATARLSGTTIQTISATAKLYIPQEIIYPLSLTVEKQETFLSF